MIFLFILNQTFLWGKEGDGPIGQSGRKHLIKLLNYTIYLQINLCFQEVKTFINHPATIFYEFGTVYTTSQEYMSH